MAKTIYTEQGQKQAWIEKLFATVEANVPIRDVIKEDKNKVAGKDIKWTERVVGTVSTAGAYEDGTNVGAAYDATSQEVTNYVQQIVVPIEVTKLTEEIAKAKGIAGVPSEVKQSIEDATNRVKQYEDWSLINGVGTAGGGGTAAQMHGLKSLGTNFNGQTATGSGAIAPADETTFLGLIKSCSDYGLFDKRDSAIIAVNGTNKASINSNWQGVANNTDTIASDGKIYNRVEYYVTDYGTLMFVVDSYVANTDILVFSKAYAKRRYAYKDIVDLPTDILGFKKGVAVGATLEYGKPHNIGVYTI